MAKLFANSEDPDQTPRSAASDLGLHCLPVTLLRVSRLQWVKIWNWFAEFSKSVSYGITTSSNDTGSYKITMRILSFVRWSQTYRLFF